MTGTITYKLPTELQLLRWKFKANSSDVGTAEKELWERAGTAHCRTEGDRNTALLE